MEKEKTRKKIVIFEDDSGDFKIRYGEATKGCDVVLYAIGPFFAEEEMLKKEAKKLLKEERITQEEFDNYSKFNRVDLRLSPNIPELEEIPRADFYFSDGLCGYAINLLNNFPRGISYLVSGDGYLMQMARERGIRIADESEIEKIINGEFE